MIITMVAMICHTLTAIAQPVCHEVIIQQSETMTACEMSQAVIADWKSKSIYSSDQWRVSAIKCVPGVYFPRDAI